MKRIVKQTRFFTLVAALYLLVGAKAFAQESIVWTDLVGMQVSADTLTKTGVYGWDNGGAASVNRLPIGTDGWVEFRAKDVISSAMVGLSIQNIDAYYATIGYAIYVAQGSINIYESGNLIGVYGNYTNDDLFRVSREGGAVKYYKNNQLFYTSATPVNGELLVDASFLETGASLYDFKASFGVPTGQQASALSIDKDGDVATISWTNGSGTNRLVIVRPDNMIEAPPVDGQEYTASVVYGQGDLIGTDAYVVYSGSGNSVSITGLEPLRKYYVGVMEYSGSGASTQYNKVSFPQRAMQGYSIEWTDLVGMQVSADTLTKTGATGWGSGGAASVNRLPIGTDGWVEFRAADLTTNRMVGFSMNNTDANYTSMGYALEVKQGSINIYESGNLIGAYGSYTNDDLFRVSREGGMVKYYKNDQLLYTSTTPTNSELLVDVSFHQTGASLYDFKASFYDPTQNNVSDHAEFLALKALYDSTNGTGWTNSTGWPTSGNWPSTATATEMSNWFGVTVSNGDITEVSLANNNLSGTLPAQLANLIKLKKLALGVNQLTGAIPQELDSLTSMQYLYLNNNQFTGEFPQYLGNLTDLKNAYFYSNQLTGTLPANLSNLSNLINFRVNNNLLEGDITLSMVNHPNLVTLYLYSNQFASIPDLSSHANQANIDYRIQNNFVAFAPIEANFNPGGTHDFSNFVYAPQGLNGDSTLVENTIGGAVTLASVMLSTNNSYQWQKYNGATWDAISGATSADYVIASSDTTYEGTYQVVVTNSVVTGLTITSAPYIIQPVNGLVGDHVEFLALKALYDSTNGAGWTDNTGWPTSGNWPATATAEEMGAWFGVTVENGDVTMVKLSSNGLVNNLPASIGQLSALKELRLDGNQLSGTIPDEIASLSALTQLWLQNNNFSGSIPENIGNLSNLVRLILNDNQLTGSIPSSVFNLTSLTHLYLYNNQLSGSIPDLFAQIPQLMHLYLYSNDFTGELPSSIGQVSNLRSLHIADIDFDPGPLPEFLQNNTLLYTLIVTSTNRTGPIPEWLTGMTNLSVLNLSSNSFEGTVPDSMGNLTNLTQLYLSINPMLTGIIPSSIGDITSLNILTIYSSGFSGVEPFAHVPGYLQMQRCHLDFASIEQFFDENGSAIPQNQYTYNPQYAYGDSTYVDNIIGGGITLNVAMLSPNNSYQWQKYNGSTWDDISGATSADYVIASSDTTYEGTYQVVVTNSVVTDLTITSAPYILQPVNGAVGDHVEFLALKALYDSTNGAGWTNNTGWPAPGNWPATATAEEMDTWYGITVENGDISEIGLTSNGLTGTIPEEIGNLLSLKKLLLDTNGLSGSIPTALGNLTQLTDLYLRNNGLTGSIPPELANMSSLKLLILNNNQLSGTIPPELGSMTSLNYLWLHQNNLTGEIPSELGNLTNLTYMQLRSNQLTGTIPSSFANLTNVKLLFLGDNNLSGTLPVFIFNLTSLQNLSIGENDFTGSIPAEIGNLVNLSTLNLADCQFTGTIPDEIGNLTQLTFLYLRQNQLSGTLPASLANLSNLNRLDVNNNNLEGDLLGSASNYPSLTILNAHYNNFTSLPDFTAHPNVATMAIHVANNSFPLSDIEANLTGVDTYPFASFTYSDQTNTVEKDSTITLGQGDITLVNEQAGGSYTHYQWQEWDGQSWTDLTGETSANYVFTPTVNNHGKKYRCHMTNNWISGESFDSDAVTILIFSGEYYAIGNGDWKNGSIWSTTPGGASANAYPTEFDKVTINGYQVQVTDDVICREVNLGSGPNGALEVSGANAFLTVKGNINITGSADLGSRVLTVNNGGRVKCE